jgi:PadR family transcriptional regulator, regulatory protein PadR
MPNKTPPIDLLGSIEYLVMKAVTTLPKDTAYGMAVFETIRSVYPPIVFGSVYADLERLRWKGYLEAKLGEPEPTRGGRARKYYRVTALGRKAFEDTRTTLTAPMSRPEQNRHPTPIRRREGLSPKNKPSRPSP